MLPANWSHIYALLRNGDSYREIGRKLSTPKALVRQEVQQAFHAIASLQENKRGPELEAIYQFLLPRFPHHIGELYKRLKARKSLDEARPIAPITGKIRVNELARQMEVPSHTLIDLLPEIGVTEKKTHSSSLDREVAERLRKRILGENDDGEELLTANDEYVGLTFLEGRFRLIALRPDGSYRYLDSESHLHDLVFTVSSETKALEHAIDELQELLNSKTAKEHDFQTFFENNPSFITSDEHVEARADIYLTREGAPTLKPDFMLRPLDPHRTSDLLELKLPSAQVYVQQPRRERLSQAVMEARCAAFGILPLLR